MWDINIHCDNVIAERKPDSVIVGGGGGGWRGVEVEGGKAKMRCYRT